VPQESNIRWFKVIRPQDFVWILLFAALAVTLPERIRDAPSITWLVGLAIVQVLEPKIPSLDTTRGHIFWIVLKLGLGYMLIGYTYGIESRYWLVLLFPVVNAATLLGAAGTLAFTLLASGAYLSFFLIHPGPYTGPEWEQLTVRLISLAIVGNLANTMAEDLRAQTRQSRRTAEQLSAANAQLREAEEAVRRSDRLAALGQLTAGLAHELRNPLGTIKASAEMLSRSVSENAVAREVAGFIASEVDRTNSLVTRFLQFARPLQARLEVADLAQALDRALAMVEKETPAVSIYKNYEPGIPPFPFDAELMERVFYNLALNAAQATAAGGAITVKARIADGTAEVAFIDRGVGIDPRQLDSIFNPFVTTKKEGVGLGLAIVSTIVDEHGGKISVESEPGKGSIFRVFLPMDRAASPPSA